MGTLLTNPKMAPGLAARVDASVRKRRSGGGLDRRAIVVFRLVAVLGIVGALVSLLLLRRREHEQVERQRAALLDAVRTATNALPGGGSTVVARAAAILTRAAGPYEGDFVDAAVRGPGALARLLSQPSLYVRGPLAAFASSSTIEHLADASVKDAFILCLLEPPPSRAEKALLTKVHAAYAGGNGLQERTESVARLYAAVRGLPFLDAPFAARVREADDTKTIGQLARDFEKAPLAEARRAAEARLLVFAMDEPGESTGLSELDGEHPHDVRVGIAELAAGKVLVRLRRRADPSFITEARRARYASGLDGCALALDVHESLGYGGP